MNRRRPSPHVLAAFGIASLALVALLVLPAPSASTGSDTAGSGEPQLKRQARASSFFTFLPRNLLP